MTWYVFFLDTVSSCYNATNGIGFPCVCIQPTGTCIKHVPLKTCRYSVHASPFVVSPNIQVCSETSCRYCNSWSSSSYLPWSKELEVSNGKLRRYRESPYARTYHGKLGSSCAHPDPWFLPQWSRMAATAKTISSGFIAITKSPCDFFSSI